MGDFSVMICPWVENSTLTRKGAIVTVVLRSATPSGVTERDVPRSATLTSSNG